MNRYRKFTSRPTVCAFVAALAFLLGSAVEGRAQEFGRMQELLEGNNRTAYYVFARPGDATIQVQVMGPRGSGLYEVSDETDLGSLLVLTGGMAILPRHSVERYRTTIKLYRQEGARRSLVYDEPLEAFVGEPGRYPVLNEGDVVAIEMVERTMFNWRDALTIGTALGTIAIAVERVLRAR